MGRVPQRAGAGDRAEHRCSDQRDAAGIVLLGLGTGLYLSAELGSGPRDSLMVAVARYQRCSIARARVAVELAALLGGLLLGGRAGAGTLVYAAAIGPVAQWGIHMFAKDSA